MDPIIPLLHLRIMEARNAARRVCSKVYALRRTPHIPISPTGNFEFRAYLSQKCSNFIDLFFAAFDTVRPDRAVHF
jgi:hypothetical protein